MLKYLIFFLSIGLFATSVSAKFANVDVPPECLIDGTTRTKPYHGRSDTSGWTLPQVYDGECLVTPKLTDDEKELIYTTLTQYLEKKAVIEHITLGEDHWIQVVRGKEDFIQKRYFETLRQKISAEMDKDFPNLKKISVYNYAAAIIGYDYRIQE